MKEHLHTSIEVRTWTDFQSHLPKFAESQWIFRADKSTVLRSSLDRALERWGCSQDRAPAIEEELTREFKRRFHHYSHWAPPFADELQWLAIMQHHGAPTRLLDWTYSYYVAIYLALNRLPQGNEIDVVLALDAKWCRDQANTAFGEKPGVDLLFQNGKEPSAGFEKYLKNAPKPTVYPVTPFHLNERLTVQQGTFLCPGNVTNSFQANIDFLKREDAKVDNRFFILTFRGELKDRRAILHQLNRMNINQATLFPGLDGFAKSLEFHRELLSPEPDVK